MLWLWCGKSKNINNLRRHPSHFPKKVRHTLHFLVPVLSILVYSLAIASSTAIHQQKQKQKHDYHEDLSFRRRRYPLDDSPCSQCRTTGPCEFVPFPYSQYDDESYLQTGRVIVMLLSFRQQQQQQQQQATQVTPTTSLLLALFPRKEKEYQ